MTEITFEMAEKLSRAVSELSPRMKNPSQMVHAILEIVDRAGLKLVLKE